MVGLELAPATAASGTGVGGVGAAGGSGAAGGTTAGAAGTAGAATEWGGDTVAVITPLGIAGSVNVWVKAGTDGAGGITGTRGSAVVLTTGA